MLLPLASYFLCVSDFNLVKAKHICLQPSCNSMNFDKYNKVQITKPNYLYVHFNTSREKKMKFLPEIKIE